MTASATSARSRTAGVFTLAYGLVVYALFLGSFLYAIGFVADAWFLPKTIDRGGLGDGEFTTVALLVDVGLLLLFAVPHSVMARTGFKRWLTTHVPQAVERSTYVLVASLCLAALMAFWYPINPTLWHVSAQPWRAVLVAGSLAGWGIVLASTVLIDHFELFGLRQVLMRLREQQPSHHAFVTPALYRIVRHPLYLGFVIAFWVTPTMTVGHLLFAVATTGYILIAVQFEERDLIHTFGQQYRDYRARVPMLVPWRRRQS
jgi:protein-S-isoprenylcysteine O-methyltransferase Ste14